MLEIIGGIFIGMLIETVGLSSYIFYKRKQNKPNISYNEVFNVKIEQDEVTTPPQVVNPRIQYNDL